MLANLTLKLPPDDPAPVPDHVGGQLEGHKLPLPPLPLHLWRRTLLIPPQRRQVGQLIICIIGLQSPGVPWRTGSQKAQKEFRPWRLF